MQQVFYLFKLILLTSERTNERERLNNNMDKFDKIFDKALCVINEKEYIDATFEDNIALLVKTLKDNDYLSADKSVQQLTQEIMSQSKNVKEIVLDTTEESIPPIKIHVKQESDFESFSATVINLKKPQEQKEFTNSMLETIFEDIVTHIKTMALQELAPDKAVDKLPKEENPANQQPGGGESALPQTPEAEQTPNI